MAQLVAANTRDPRFNSIHRQTFIEHLITDNCVENTKINKKEAGNGSFFKKEINAPLIIILRDQLYHLFKL